MNKFTHFLIQTRVPDNDDIVDKDFVNVALLKFLPFSSCR